MTSWANPEHPGPRRSALEIERAKAGNGDVQNCELPDSVIPFSSHGSLVLPFPDSRPRRPWAGRYEFFPCLRGGILRRAA